MIEKKFQESKSVQLYIYAGIILGMLLVGIIYIFWLRCLGVPLIPSSIIELHGISFIAWIVDILPFIFGYGGYLIMRQIKNTEKILKDLMQQEQNYYHTISSVLDKISKGNIEVELLGMPPNDEIGRSLSDLKEYLIKNKEVELRRREEDRQRNWITEGLAKFAELLRENNSDLFDLSNSIIVNLVKYLNANQGAFFLVEQEGTEKYFDLKGCYAWGRKKYAKKRIEWGDDLVGACALEKDIILLSDVPDNYIRITSGLGDANPRFIALVPLVANNNDDVLGVIEVAAFKIFDLYEIEFLRKVAESIASTVYAVRNNIQTRKLLEKSQQQAEELAQQEEELRQNLEELRATQEQIAFQSRKLEIFTEAVNHSMLRLELDSDARITDANEKFVERMGYLSKDEVLGKHVSVFINYRDQESFFTIWNRLQEEDVSFEGEVKFQSKQGKDMWLMASLVVERSEMSQMHKVVFLANDITMQKELDLDYRAQIEALNRSSLKAQFLPDGMMVDGNDIFLDVMGINKEELFKRSIFEMIAREEQDSFKELWEKVLHGESYKGQLRQVTFRKEEKWFQCTFTSMHNIYGEIIKVIYIANDITEQKIMELDAQRQAEILRKQEEQLRQSQQELSIKLEQAKKEMAEQYKEIEKIKIRNERTLEGAHDAIITFNRTGTIEFFNKSAELLWGYSKSEVLGENVGILFSDNAKTDDPFVAAIVNGEDKQVGLRKEIKVLKRNGEEVPVLLLLSEAKISDEEHSYTAFIQNIEVELF